MLWFQLLSGRATFVEASTDELLDQLHAVMDSNAVELGAT